MSNIIRIPAVSFQLDPKQHDLVKMPVGVQDLDGNGVQVNEEGVVVYLAETTTWRELRNFIRDAVAKYALPIEGKVYVDVPGVRDEFDNFETKFLMTICLSQCENWTRYAF